MRHCVTGPGGPPPSDGPTAGAPGEDVGEGHPSETSHPGIGVALGRRTPKNRGRRGKPLQSKTAAQKERDEVHQEGKVHKDRRGALSGWESRWVQDGWFILSRSGVVIVVWTQKQNSKVLQETKEYIKRYFTEQNERLYTSTHRKQSQPKHHIQNIGGTDSNTMNQPREQAQAGLNSVISH